MTGSWNHMTIKSGELRNNESFCDMVENLGDAYETAEECFGMVWWLAAVVEEQREWGSSAKATREQLLEVIREAKANYQSGLALGGVQDE